jgi:hypothetical protein
MYDDLKPTRRCTDEPSSNKPPSADIAMLGSAALTTSSSLDVLLRLA